MKPSKHLREFDRSLPMALLKAREAVMKKFTPHLRAHELSPQQWRVLRALYETDELEMTALSEQCFLLLPSLSRIIKNLNARELVTRVSFEQDRRRTVIGLTIQGKELVKLMAPESEARYQHITETFGYGKLELLYELLDELVAKLAVAEEQNDSVNQHR